MHRHDQADIDDINSQLTASGAAPKPSYGRAPTRPGGAQKIIDRHPIMHGISMQENAYQKQGGPRRMPPCH
jgi:hypothetical protein